MLVSAPVDLDFELLILKTGIDLVGNMLRTKFATTLEDDQNALKSGGIAWRKYLAITHRTAQKEVLYSQERILTLALKIMTRLKGSKELGQGEVVTLKDAYIRPIEDLEQTPQEVLENRLRLRHYLQDFEFYANKQTTDF